jgi:hypothetical protein
MLMAMLTGKTRDRIAGQIKEAAGKIGGGVLAALGVAVAAMLVAVTALVVCVRGLRRASA